MKTRLEVKDYRGVIVKITLPIGVNTDDIIVSNDFEIEKSELICETNVISINQK